MKNEQTVKTPGEAISVLIQVARLAQSKGILTLDDAVVTKSAIDYLENLANNSKTENSTENSTNENLNNVELTETTNIDNSTSSTTKAKRKTKLSN